MKKKTKETNVMLNEVVVIIIISITFLLMFCVYSKEAGILGNFIGDILRGFLGIGAFIMPLIATIYFYYIPNKDIKIFTLLVLIFISIIHIHNKKIVPPYDLSIYEFIKYYFISGDWNNGGLLGASLSNLLIKLIGINGAYIMLYSSLLIIIMFIINKPIFQLFNKYFINRKLHIKKNIKEEKEVTYEFIETTIPTKILEPLEKVFNEEIKQLKIHTELPEEILEAIVEDKKNTIYQFPNIDLLNKKSNKTIDKLQLETEMKENAIKLERTLKNFGVNANVLDIFRGPNVTRYELQPKEGVKVSKIVNLSDDIALNLAATALRIEAPIPGKPAIGIEIPNKDIQMVYLREIIESRKFKNFQSKVAFGVGRDISGNIIVSDISQMPHTLIAGSTGSGKSVCINTIITSILYKSTPEEVKLIMIDPKVVELNIYNGIPHLLIPVVTEPEKASKALNWAVSEMLNRYKLFAEHNVRDIKGYNECIKNKEQNPMPNIVIIIDELSDLMMASPKEVEDSICRLAQMARAAGMHLIIATQRPSVDVITGVIKANIPSRIAFAVSSGIDSRTILDMIGAEKLLGNGDMLFYPSGISKPIRVQGAFISDKEVEKVVGFIKKTNKTEYNQEIFKKLNSDK